MTNQIDGYLQRPFKYANVEGFFDIYTGIAWMGFALVLYLWGGSSDWRRFLLSYVVVLVPLGVLGSITEKWVKQYITYPRTGYVAYRRPPLGVLLRKCGWILLYVTALSAGASLAFAWALRAGHPSSINLVAPAIFSSGYLTGLFKKREVRSLVLAAASIAIGVILNINGLGPIDGLMWFLILIGAAQLLAGAVVLAGYLRHTSPPEVPSE